jgi:hypothetical protein
MMPAASTMERKVYKVWKVFAIGQNGRLEFLFCTHDGGRSVTTGKWLEASDDTLCSEKASFYPAGFHVFFTWKSAKEYSRAIPRAVSLVRVRAVGLVARGSQQSPGWGWDGDEGLHECGVFREIFVPKQRHYSRTAPPRCPGTWPF